MTHQAHVIIEGQLLVQSNTAALGVVPGWLRLTDGYIAEVHFSPCPHQADFGGPEAIISPGFIDTHLHLPQFDAIGVDGLTLLDWLEQVIFPAEARWADADFAAEMTRRVVDQLICHGTTGFVAFATVHHQATQAAMRICEQRGLRAMIGQVLMDQQAPDALIRPADQLLAECAAMLASAEPQSRVQPIISPRFAITCSPILLADCGELARRFNAPVQTHLAETLAECRQVEHLHGHAYVDVYHQAGLLTPRSLFAHGIHLTDAERQTLAAAGSAIAHCPVANTFLQSGVMDRQAHLNAGLTMTLGSDIAGGHHRSMVRVAQAMVDAIKTLNRQDDGRRPIPTAGHCWWQITTGNADALGWCDAGRLEVGAAADLLIIEPNIPWREHADPLGNLLWAWDDRWLRHTFIAGQLAE